MQGGHILTDKIYGGNTPTLHDVRTGGDLVFKFSKILLRRHENLSKGVRDFIVANVLRYWKDIESLIQSKPSGKYVGEQKNQHPLISNIQMTCVFLNISEIYSYHRLKTSGTGL